MIRLRLASALLVLILTTAAGIALPAMATPVRHTSSSTTTSVYQPGSAETDSIGAWLRRNHQQTSSWDEEDTYDLGVTTVTITQTAASDRVSAQSDNAPPVPLPSTGTLGQTITILVTYPGGASETWTYQWGSMGGGVFGWVETDHEDHHPIESLPAR